MIIDDMAWQDEDDLDFRSQQDDEQEEYENDRI